MNCKHLLLPTFLAFFSALVLPPVLKGQTTVSIRVNASADDAEQNLSSGSVSINSSDLELAVDGSASQLVGMRFNAVSIPQGSTITGAYVEFETDVVWSSACSLTLSGQAADNAATFTTSSNNLSSRTKTSATAAWSPAAWSTVNGKHQSPSLVSIVQEIVSRSGWASGNSLVIFAQGTGTREAESYDGESAAAPLLVVTYVACSALTSAGTVGSAETSCLAFNPAAMTELTAPGGGSGTLEYQWQSSSNNSTWSDVFGATAASYDPASVSATTYYRRAVRRSGCTTYLYSASVAKTVTVCVENCTNGTDDDGDALVDCADPGCPAPTPSVSGASSVCSGEVVNLTASGGATYAWNTGASTAAISPSPSVTTTYVVTVTASNGCAATASHAVTATICTETNCANGVDDDADGSIDCHDTDCLSLPSAAGSPTYRTIADGSWSSPGVWLGGLIPGYDISGDSVLIEHDMICYDNLKLLSASKLMVVGGGLTMQGVNLTVEYGELHVLNGSLIYPGTGNLELTTSNARFYAKNATLTLGQNFANAGGRRVIENTCMTVQENFSKGSGTDSLKNVCARVGISSSGNGVYNSSGLSYLLNCEFELPNGNFLNQSSGTISGGNNVIWVKNGNLDNAGAWSASVAKYCVSGSVNLSATYLPASEDCANVAAYFSPCSCDCSVSTPEICTNGTDDDGDGLADCADGDCPAPAASVTGTNVIFTGDNTTLTASGGGTYLWNTGATTATITVNPSTTTTYTVTVTAANGCTDIGGRTVTVEPDPGATCGEIENKGFESNLDNWGVNGSGGTVTTDANYGTKAVVISADNSGVYQNFAATPGQIFTASAFVKATGSLTWAGVGLIWFDASFVKIDETAFDNSYFSSDYQYFEMVDEAPPGAVWGQVYAWKSGGTGSMTVDDFCASPETAASADQCGDVFNGGFELGALGWQGDLDGVSISADAYAGSAALEMTSDHITLTRNVAPLTPGAQYQLSFYAKRTNVGGWAEAQLNWRDANGNIVSSNYVAIDYDVTHYQLLQLSAEAPADAASLDVAFYKDGGGNVFIDEVCLDLIPDAGDCNCSENLLVNGGYESANTNLTFPIAVQGTPASALENGEQNVLGWLPGISANARIFYLNDAATNAVNNPEGDRFVLLPPSACWVSGNDLGQDLLLEIGAEYEICFWAAAWNESLNATNGLPDGGSVSQVTGGIHLEFNYENYGTRVVATHALPPAAAWANLTWRRFSYRFIFDGANPLSQFYLTSTAETGVALDGVSLTRVACSQECLYVRNSGFENGLTDWSYSGTVSAAGTPRTGAGAARLSSNNSTIGQTIVFDPKTDYTLTVWARLETGATYSDIGYAFWDYDWTGISGSSVATQVTGTTYAQYTFNIANPPANAKFIRLTGYKSGSSGALLIDDYCLEARPEEDCTNATDDDGDGLTDCADPACSNGLTVNVFASVSTICTGGSATLTADATGGTGTLSYAWSDGLGSGASKVASPASTTTYVVTVTSENGCTATASATVSVVADPAISTHPAAISQCLGGSQTLSVSATGGSPSLTFQWQSSSDNLTFTNVTGATSTNYVPPSLAIGTLYYRVVVSASGEGCGSATSNSAAVVVNGSPAASISGSTNICAGTDATLTATGGVSYLWGNGATTASIIVSPTVPTSYAVTVTGVGGCTAATQTTVFVKSVPIANAGADATICSGNAIAIGASASGGVSPYSFLWSNGWAQAGGNGVSPAANATYSVTVTDAQGCTGVDQVSVGVNASPTVNAGNDFSVCNGQSGTLTASVLGGVEPNTFNWSHGLGTANPVTVSPLLTATYTVTVTSNNGCIATDQVTVSVSTCTEICTNGLDDDMDGLVDCADPQCGVTVVASQDVSICAGNSTAISAVASPPGFTYMYNWNQGLGLGASKIVNPASTKTYVVTVTSATSGCTASDQTVVTVNNCSELCANGTDDDSDGLTDCADPDCAAVGAPILANDAYVTCPAMPFSERVTYNDGNLQTPVYGIASPPAHGTVTIDWTGKFTYVPTDFACQTDQFSYEVTNSATGCASTAVVTLTLADNTPPELLNLPEDFVLDCDDQVPAPPLVQGFDACPGISIDYETTTTESAGSNCGEYAVSRTWTLTDLCGNVSSESQIITVEDQTPPQIFRVYTLQNGGKMLAGISPRVSHFWKTVQFPMVFKNAPVVLAQLSSDNDPAAATVQIRNVYRQGFELRLREEEAADGIHAGDSVAWVAFEPGNNLDGRFAFLAGTFANVNHLPDTLTFSQPYSEQPLFFSNLQSTNEDDPTTVRHPAISTGDVRFFLEEENSLDAETAHASETLGFLAMAGEGALTAADGEVFGEAGTLNLTNAWATVSLSREYVKPVVVLGGMSNGDPQPVTCRVRNVRSNSFEVRLQEWAYLDGSHHPAETVSWMVMEGSVPGDDGFYCNGGGKKLKVGTNVFLSDNCDLHLEINEEALETMLPSGLRTVRSWSAVDDCNNQLSILHTDTCGVAALKARAKLLGAMISNGGGNLMRDDLRKKTLVPVVEPYSELPAFPHVENENAKVVICHHPGQPDQQTMTIHISQLQAYLDQGDVLGTCPPLPVALPPGAASAQFRTIADGAWTSPATWQGGNVPPVGNVNGLTISVEHDVTLASGELFLKNNTKLWVTNGSLVIGNGNVKMQGAELYVNNAYLEVTAGYLYSWTGACKIQIKDSEVRVGLNFSHESGWRKLENVCLSTGTDFVRGYALNVYDTLINVTGIVGGHFKNHFGGAMYASNCQFKIVSGDLLNAASNSISGNNLRLLLENGSVTNLGTWTIPIVQLCVAGTLNVPLSYLLVAEDCSNIATLFSSCNPGAGGNGNGGGNGSPSGAGGAGGGDTGNRPVLAGNGFLDPNLLDYEGNAAIVDWMLLELRSPADEDEILGYATVLLLRDGSVVTETGDSTILFRYVQEGEYYVTMRHRNHLPVMTDDPIFLSLADVPMVDFTDPALPVRGGTAAGRIENGSRLMWSGDFNEDGKVVYQGPGNDVFSLFMRVATDPGNLDYLANYISAGYNTNDLNLDGKMIYQGPGNDRALVLFRSTLAHPQNGGNFANFVIYSYLP